MNISTLPNIANIHPQTERVVAIDVLKCFAIFMMLWAHGIQHLITADCVENPVFRWIYSFHMPLFMMVSGYFSGKSMQLPFGQFAGKKLKQIALPGFAWPWLYALIGLCIWGGSINFNKQLTDYIPFWFLWSLLICNLLAYLAAKVKYGTVITLLISQMIPFANVIYMYPAFALGQTIAENKDIFEKNKKSIIVGSALTYVVLMSFWGADVWHLFAQTQERLAVNGYFAAGTFYVGKTIYKIGVNLSGSVMFLSLFLVLEPLWKSRAGHFMGYIGKYTLIIYILQSFIIEMQMPKYVCLDFLSWPVFNFVATPIVALCVMLFSVAVAALMDKNKYTRLLFLGR